MATLSRLTSVPLTQIRSLGEGRARALDRAGVSSVADLLLHIPRTYIDRSASPPLSEVAIGEEVTVIGKVTSVKGRYVRKGLHITEAVISDGSSRLRAVWFNQPFRERQLAVELEVAISGEMESFRGRLQMSSPDVDVLSSPQEPLATGRIVPIHPVVGKVKTGHIRRAIHNALKRSRPIPDPVPERIRRIADVPERDWAFERIHFPEQMSEPREARRRLAFDEFFRLELALAIRKRRNEEESQGIPHSSTGKLTARFEAGLPYSLTPAQRRVLDEIRADLGRKHAMHRLLQGEVGSGKTVVAVLTLLTGVEGGWQGAVMAPTEVLAEQHYLGILELLEEGGLAAEPKGAGASLGMESLFAEGEDGVTVALLTGNRALLSDRPGAGRNEVVEAIRSGAAHLVVGTHALIQEGVDFHRLGVVVVDEQHRFGVSQRVRLKDKAGDVEPDLLIMTATPIPRTLSMTLYGDLDVSTIDELPPGRTPIKTIGLSLADQDRAWEMIREQVASGRQAFVVCPLVEESDRVEAASATAEYERLQGVLSGLRLGLIHGQLTPADKEEVMGAFRAGELDVLVSTTVIEVGIDVPNATVMVIEDADRFGLSQLHQLRGRVGRGRYPGTCVLIADPTTPEGEERIAAMVRTTDGFELADVDLRIRGQGTVFDTRQSGRADLRVADILADHDLLEIARREAFALVESDPTLSSYPDLAEEVNVVLGEDMDRFFAEVRG